MAPVAVSKDKPVERVGEIVQEVTAPLLSVGVTVVMAVPFVSVNGLPL